MPETMGSGVAIFDFDSDGNADIYVTACGDGNGLLNLYVANDSSPNFLFRNLGDGSFEETGLLLGVAFGESRRPEAGMGLAWPTAISIW